MLRMVITPLGIQSFKITHGDTTIAFNPISKKSKNGKPTSYGADICMITTHHPDFDGADSVTRKEKQPVVLQGPGEYEVGGILIKGFKTNSAYDGKDMGNTIYALKVDGLNVVFCGAMSDSDIPADVKETLADTDIIFVPIGGDGVLEGAEAAKIASKREAKIVIPMHFDGVGKKDSLKTFLKEMSAESVKPVDKLTVKVKDVDGKKGEVVLLK